MSICANTTYTKKGIWDSTFCQQLNANDRKMTGISAFGALVASQFSDTTPSILRIKPVRPVSNVTKQDTVTF
jgi:hypothetical protein